MIRICDALRLVLACCLMGLLPFSVQAEYLGLINGRTANPGNLSDLSVELGFVTGDLGVEDYQNIGARINYRFSSETVLFADVGVSEFGQADGTPFGLGAFYHLSRQRITDEFDITAKASYHQGDYEVGRAEVDLSSLSFEVLFSGVRPISANGLMWYGNVGIHRLSADYQNLADDSSTEFGIGAGLALPTGAGDAFIGVDHIDEMLIGIGFRYLVY